MEFGQPSDGAPAGAVAVARAALGEPDMGYWESVPLRQRIACHYDDQYGVDLDPQRILLTCGASPALVLALLTGFAAGSRVMTARPGHLPYRNSLCALHMVPVEVVCGASDRFPIHSRHLPAAHPHPHDLPRAT